MKLINLFFTLIIFFSGLNKSQAQTLPSSIIMKDVAGGTFTMGSNSLMGSPDQQIAAPEHQVTLSPYSISEAEITNVQYVEFLNAAFDEGLIEIVTGNMGPDNGKRIIQGTASSNYEGKVLYTLDGIRVLKDHDNGDGDGNEFTGSVEPENPLNISYIGFNEANNNFYVKDPFDVNDFHWLNICDYQNYGTTPMQFEGPILNDFDDWAGAGQNLSDELEGWTETNPQGAVNLPSQSEVAAWPVTFIRWWGAKAFADYYGVTLPTEAQWEFAAKAGQDFQWATYDGIDTDESNWNQLGLGTVALGHVRAAISGTPNPFGLYNLGGNCWEWIADNYVAPYNTDPVTDPLIEVAGSTTRCWRGGAWNYHEATLQSAIRFFDEENRGNDHFGFRITSSNSTTSVDQINSQAHFNIYPNPAVNFVRVQLSNHQKSRLDIYSIEGKLLFSTEVETEIIVDLSTWERGVYLFKIDDKAQKVQLH